MNQRWNLDDLYFSFEDENFSNDREKCRTLIAEFQEWSEGISERQSADVIEEFINKENEINAIFVRLFRFAHLTLATDVENAEAAKYAEELQNLFVNMTGPLVKFRQWLLKQDKLPDLLNENKFLQEHTFAIKEMKEQAEHLLSEPEEIVISQMRNTGSSAWTKLQNTLTSTLMIDIEIEGKKESLPLSMIRNMAQHENRTVRENAFEAELAAYPSIEKSSAAALNAIKGEVQLISRKRGFGSVLEETLKESRISRDTLNAMLTAMRNALPGLREFLKIKAEMLGIDGPLPFYDLFAPVGDAQMKFTYEEAYRYIVDNFRTFSDDLADFADHAFTHNWIDAEPRYGKRGGAFCSGIHPLKQSRVLTNFNNTFDSVKTLAHELGHAYHGYCLRNESYINTDYPIPIAETASIFCESIIINAALERAEREEKFAILEGSIADSVQVIVDIYSRFIFESRFMEERRSGSLNADKIKELMIEAQKEAYGDGLDHNCLHPFMWVNKPHYYYAAANFYNWPYAFGHLFAKGLYAQYIVKGKNFVPLYVELLKNTGKKSVNDLTAIIGIDINKGDFWEHSLDIITGEIEDFKKTCKK